VLPLSVEDRGDRVGIGLGEVAERSLVVLADAWAEGWSVRVDGESAELLRVGGFFRGVVVEPGAGNVVFLYRPAGWVWGLRLGGVGALLLVGLVVFGRRS